MKLRHHGSSRFLPRKFKPITNWSMGVKPLGGLWTSPVNTKFGWKEWCECEHFGVDVDLWFDLNFVGRLCTIDSLALPTIAPRPFSSSVHPDFVAIARSYDAIHLTERGQERTRLTHPRNLYGWDCETVLVLNRRAVRVIRKK